MNALKQNLAWPCSRQRKPKNDYCSTVITSFTKKNYAVSKTRTRWNFPNASSTVTTSTLSTLQLPREARIGGETERRTNQGAVAGTGRQTHEGGQVTVQVALYSLNYCSGKERGWSRLLHSSTFIDSIMISFVKLCVYVSTALNLSVLQRDFKLRVQMSGN